MSEQDPGSTQYDPEAEREAREREGEPLEAPPAPEEGDSESDVTEPDEPRDPELQPGT